MPPKQNTSDSPSIEASLSGMVVAIKVAVGEKVRAGQDLLIMEAMKMENILLAEREGVIAEIFIKEGENVQAKQELMRFEV